MNVIKTAIPEVMIIEPKVFGDDRGFFFESFNQKAFQEATGLDRAFVQDVTRDPRGLRLLEGIVQLCRSLGMTTVAEGVETRTQQSLLADLGCEFVQGYLHSPPLPASSFEAMTFAGSSIAA